MMTTDSAKIHYRYLAKGAILDWSTKYLSSERGLDSRHGGSASLLPNPSIAYDADETQPRPIKRSNAGKNTPMADPATIVMQQRTQP